jgi:hypothetical protein
MAYEIDYNDKRFTEVEADKKQALSQLEETYAGMINNSDKYYQAQIDASKNWAEKQTQLQQKQTDFAIDKIEQEKAKAKKDYTKEQSGAYVDWQKQSNQYGANAEQMAAGGFTGSGYSESAQVSMYNTYQNRVSTAREAYNFAVQNYNNSITEARLQNNSVLAEIAYNALQQQLELSLQGFQYKNQLLLDKAARKTETENTYYQRYQDVLKQINQENALAEEVRQFNEQQALQKQQMANTKAYQDAQLALEREKFNYQKAQDTAAAINKPSGNNGNKGSTANETTKKVNAAKQKSRESVKVSTYTQAVKVLEQAGIKGDGGLMTDDEWERRKTSGSNRAEFGYASYVDYLNNFVAWRLKNPE